MLTMGKGYEVVKVVKGYAIERTPGTRRFFWVKVREMKGGCEFRTFHTIKAAAEYIEAHL